jgi:peptidoglycan/xylan/chitin deacetylase (PgdA/CDA1 family)
MICFSVDVEEWYHSPLYKGIRYSSNIENSIDYILDILSINNSKATFFWLGETAKKYNKVLKKVSSKGHEIGFHSYDHKLLFYKNYKKYKKECAYWKAYLEDNIGQVILGHREPAWSVDNNNLWVFDVLAEIGFLYDNSLHDILIRRKKKGIV